MKPEEITEHILDIPSSPLGQEPKDHELWEGIDGHATFMMTRHQLPMPGGSDFMSLSVSGSSKERHRLIGEFTEVLGSPFEYQADERDHVIEIAAWILDLDISSPLGDNHA